MSTRIDSDPDIRAFLNRSLDDNFQRLRTETGRSLSADGREIAWQQVWLYWLKLSEVARSITDTEVYLTLPNQQTPAGRRYAIEGVVDIVRAEGHTVMYDIKSFDAEHVRNQAHFYQRQLNVYAHIWQTLRGEALDETAIIATAFPQAVRDAYESDNDDRLAHALARWEPVVKLPFSESGVADTVAEFGEVVDQIEEGAFQPRTAADLDTREGARGDRFATSVCRNCDARFACPSYRQWALGSTSHVEDSVRRYFADVADEDDIAGRLTATLDDMPDADDLTQDFL